MDCQTNLELALLIFRNVRNSINRIGVHSFSIINNFIRFMSKLFHTENIVYDKLGHKFHYKFRYLSLMFSAIQFQVYRSYIGMAWPKSVHDNGLSNLRIMTCFIIYILIKSRHEVQFSLYIWIWTLCNARENILLNILRMPG